MDLAADFKSYQDRVTAALVNVTKSSSQLANQDLSFHRTSEKFSRALDEQSTHLLRLTNRLLKAASRETQTKLPSLQDKDDLEDHWHKIVDVVDNLLEKADTSLDEFTGALRRMSPARQPLSESESSKPAPKPRPAAREAWAYASLPKPQLLFTRKVNNFEQSPWRPLLREKPHGLISLQESIGPGDAGYKHPYAHEIESMQYPKSLYEVSSPIKYTPPEQSSPIYVDTEDGVHEMLQELKLAKEIAVDLEHHDKHSFIGLVSLMQISTRSKDWIVDTLKPWRENLQVLNEVFADPSIVKVLHGSTMDVIWLQRDLGLYLVGLFDTYYASTALQFPQKSLAFLLKRYADVDAQKQFQLADWRIRPLPQELLDYARADTHYLLYIYDNLRNALLESSTPNDDLMEFVLSNSRKEALQTYERPVYDAENGLGPGGWLRMLMSRSTMFTNEQFGVFRALHQWRDQKARELDEGDQTIMPQSLIFSLANDMPKARPYFYQRGSSRFTSHVMQNLPEIIEVIRNGQQAGRQGPSIYEAIEKNGPKVGNMFGKNKWQPRKKEDHGVTGVGATLQLLRQSPQTPPPSSITPTKNTTTEPIAVRTGNSQLFGPIAARVQPVPVDDAIVAEALRSLVPLDMIQPATPATEIKTSDFNVTSAFPLPESNQITNGNSRQSNISDEIFILRDRNKKRKAEEVLNDPDEGEINILNANPTPTATPSQDPAQYDMKKSKKAEKRAKKAAKEAEMKASREHMVPFDYANAKSILNAKGEPLANGAEPMVAPLNPFARALDTSTGARRSKMGKELAGKSHTFSS